MSDDEQLQMFARQELWLLREYARVPKRPLTVAGWKLMHEIRNRTVQLRRERTRFLARRQES